MRGDMIPAAMVEGTWLGDALENTDLLRLRGGGRHKTKHKSLSSGTDDEELASAISGLKRKFADTEEGMAWIRKIEEVISKRPKGVQDQGPKVKAVFEAPPNGIEEDVFALKYGLLHQTQVMPGYDRFKLRQMGDAALATVHCCVGKAARNAAIAYEDPVQEDKSAGVHTVMLLGFRAFTKPSQQGKGKYEMSVEVVGDSEDDELEQDTDESTDQKEKTREHKIYVFNQAYTSVVHKDGKVLRIVADWKTLATQAALLQAACYAVDSLQDSFGLEKKYRPPVYLEVWDAYKWFYGILEIDAYVDVEDGNITEDSLEYFPKKEAPPIGRNFTRSYTRREVLSMFSSWKAELRRQRKIQLPDGRYPVGRLFICKKSYTMPRYIVDGSELSAGAKRFYEGNLKVLVGRRGWVHGRTRM